MTLPVRKHPRLKNFDYSQCGCYHITICTKDRRPVLSRVIPSKTPFARASIQLTQAGEVTESFIRNIPLVYQGVFLDKYVIMPNHIQLLLFLDATASVSISSIVRSLKSMVTRKIGTSVWQDSFYDVVIRNDVMYQCEWNYIDGNPDKWSEDDLYVKSQFSI